jgi:hypothetical protein
MVFVKKLNKTKVFHTGLQLKTNKKTENEIQPEFYQLILVSEIKPKTNIQIKLPIFLNVN